MSEHSWTTVLAPLAVLSALCGGILWFNHKLVIKRRARSLENTKNYMSKAFEEMNPSTQVQPGNFYNGNPLTAENFPQPQEQQQVGEVAIPVTQGWVTLSLQDLFKATPVLKDVFNGYRGTVGQWAHQIPNEWWSGLRAFPRVPAMMHANHMRTVLDENELIALKMKMTASALIFDKAIPQACFLLNEKVIEMTLRYLALTETAQVTIDKVDVWEPFLLMPERLDILVNSFLWHPPIASNLFSDTDRPPSLRSIKDLLVPTLTKLPPLTDDQVRKILTCIYLAAGVSIPMDFLYIDMDVHDFVKKHGEYERVATA